MNNKSVVITKNGEAAWVLISPKDYDRWIERDHFLKAIEHGLTDSESGKILSDKESKEAIEKEFGKLE